MKLKEKKPEKAVLAPPRPMVSPGVEPKSGCRWCPLFAWSPDFTQMCAHGGYNRDAEKIRLKESEGHGVRTRCVEEPSWTKVDVLFVGEAPGADEDREGIPFVGRSGKLLREAIGAMSHVKPEKCGITNVVRCRPPRNRVPNKTEVRSCSPRLLAEIKERKPKVLVALGNSALEYLTENTGITTYNGRVMNCTVPGLEHLKVIACLHPAYVLRADHEIERFIQALETVQNFLTGDIEDKGGPGKYIVADTVSRVRKLLRRLRRSKTPVACDTETGGLSPFQTDFPALLCFSFSDKEGYGYTIPYDHKDSPWCVGGKREHERPLIKKLLRRFFRSRAPKVLQNGKFDALHIRVALDVEIVDYEDTMLTHLCTDERHGTHGLKQQAWAHTSMGGYEKPLEDYIAKHREADPRKGGSYANIPGRLLFRYGGMDTDVTLRVRNGLKKDPELVNNKRLRNIAYKFLPALSMTLTELEFNGARVDRTQVGKLDVMYRAQMDESQRKIQGLKRVKKFARLRGKLGKEPTFNPGSSQQLGEVLFGLYKERPVEMTDKGFENLTLRYARTIEKWRKAGKGRGPKPHFRHIVNAAIKNKEWGHFSTKADVLHELDRRGNKLAPLLLGWRSAETLHKTFVAPLRDLLDGEDCVHGTYNIIGTVTGRLSSSDPNLQNIPNRGGGLIKRAYVSRFGRHGLIGQVDYSQIELRIAACWFKEPTMMKTYRDGADLHLVTALDISGLTLDQYNKLDKHVQKEIRTQAKRVNFGILYGGGPPALMGALKKDGVFMTIEQCQTLIERYFAVRPKLKQGIEALEAEALKHGYLESFTGRRRRIPEVFADNDEIVSRALRQAVNFPIQNGASEMTLMSLVLIHREMERKQYRSKIILTVHDSIAFDLHVDEAFEVLSMAKRIMENLPKLSDQVLPGLDWSWLTVPLVADVDLGPTWGTMVEKVDPDNVDVDELWGKMRELTKGKKAA